MDSLRTRFAVLATLLWLTPSGRLAESRSLAPGQVLGMSEGIVLSGDNGRAAGKDVPDDFFGQPAKGRK